MGEWKEWSEFKCIKGKGRKRRHSNCGKCSRFRKKIVIKECENGGDCSCKPEHEREKKKKRCGKYGMKYFAISRVQNFVN